MIELQHVSKTFENAGGRVDALRDVSLTIADGDIYGIIGMSGAGKSTLVRCINMLERPTEGRVIVNGHQLDAMTPAQLRAARREITMIFQRFNLLMQRTCLQNICFPMELAGVPKEKATARARELLELVGLPDKADAYPAQLSGGQKQLLNLASVMVLQPKVLILDEPTSQLDPIAASDFLATLGKINRELGTTVLLTEHRLEEAFSFASRVAVMDGGKCILQLRGVRPFLSDKYDITKHPNYHLTADADPRNAFDIEQFLSTRLKPKPNEVYQVYEVDASDSAPE